MSNNKKQSKKAKGNNNKSIMFIILAVILAAFTVYTIINNNQKQQAASSDPGEPPAQGESVISVEVQSGADLKILKSEISEKAKFYPYKAGDTYLEVLAVKATDGSIRTALNTCQICFESGRGYYEQVDDTLVCQNCGNVFGVDDVEVVRGGCNPVPVLEENKTDDGEYISIKKEFLEGNKDLFANWKK